MTKSKGKVIIKCDHKQTLPLSYLTPLQDELKVLSTENYKKLKARILKKGFKYPIFVWSDDKENLTYILDGHQRYFTLLKMKDEGYVIPKIPVLFVQAKNIDEARESVLELASQFGELSEVGLKNFLEKAKFKFDLVKQFNFPVFEFSAKKDAVKKVEFEVKTQEDQNRFLVLVELVSEKEQQSVFEKLTKEGYKCQIMN